MNREARISVKQILLIAFAGLFFRLALVSLKSPGFRDGWGGEMASVASSLAQGQGFSSPFWVATGPTAWVSPVYPYVLSVIFRVFGVHAPASREFAHYLNAVISALTGIPIALIGRKVFGQLVGLTAGWLWALCPLTGYSECLYIWNTSLYALLLAVVFLVGIQMHEGQSSMSWCGFGLLMGFTALTEAACLPFLVVLIAWQYFRQRANRKTVCLTLLGLSALIGLSLLRNSVAFGQPVFLRSNFGLELFRGLHEDDFASAADLHITPSRDVAERDAYLKQGEIPYMQQKLHEALEFIADHPLQVAARSLRRWVAFWVGSAHVASLFWFSGRFYILKHVIFVLPALLAFYGLYSMIRYRIEGLFLFSFLLLAYPLPYCFTPTWPRYRSPIEPEMIVISSFVLVEHWRRRNTAPGATTPSSRWRLDNPWGRAQPAKMS